MDSVFQESLLFDSLIASTCLFIFMLRAVVFFFSFWSPIFQISTAIASSNFPSATLAILKDEGQRDAMKVESKAHKNLARSAKRPLFSLGKEKRCHKVDVKPGKGSVAAVVERHPLGPRVHEGSRVLLCGTFPPVRKSINFYYPNANNDMWKILGLLFFGEVHHFYTPQLHDKDTEGPRPRCSSTRHLDEQVICAFAATAPIGFCDVAQEVRRGTGNSSDANIDILSRTNFVEQVLGQTPNCDAIVTTGALAMSILIEILVEIGGTFRDATGQPFSPLSVSRTGAKKYSLPSLGGRLEWHPVDDSVLQRPLWIYRAPSTSRAFPMPLAEKEALYRSMIGAHLDLDTR